MLLSSTQQKFLVKLFPFPMFLTKSKNYCDIKLQLRKKSSKKLEKKKKVRLMRTQENACHVATEKSDNFHGKLGQWDSHLSLSISDWILERTLRWPRNKVCIIIWMGREISATAKHRFRLDNLPDILMTTHINFLKLLRVIRAEILSHFDGNVLRKYGQQ